MSRQFAVVGLGRFTTSVARGLAVCFDATGPASASSTPERYHDAPLSDLLADCAERVVPVRISREMTEVTDDGEATKTVRIPVPTEDTPLRAGDTIALIGPSRVLERL